MNLIPRFTALLAALMCASSALSQSALIRVEVTGRSRDEGVGLARTSYRHFLSRLSALTLQSRTRLNPDAPFIFPATARIRRNGIDLPTAGRTRSTDLTLEIDPAFNAPADPTRAAFMASVYANARSTMDAVFGPAAIGGTVRVINDDDLISDRNALIGGIYLPNNGSGGREIRMPFNGSRAAAALNLIHCVLLAYLPEPAYGFDVYYEGLVRAAVARIARIPAAMPGVDADQIEAVLENTYEVGPDYQGNNQRALIGRQFIAPNLLSSPLPSGTLGGLFLMRYRMAGSMWTKVLTEYPSFAANLNQALRLNPLAAQNSASLKALAAGVINNLIPNGTVERVPFSDWLDRQFIADTSVVPGPKVHVEVQPVTSDLSGQDFGVFNFIATYFDTAANGNETLLSGSSFPIFWDRNYNRILPGAQSERIEIAASYGSVTPNFTNVNAGQSYRVSCDFPVQDRLVRRYVPAGAVSRPGQTTPSNLYGSVVGFSVDTGQSLFVRPSLGSTVLPDIPVQNFAFGAVITEPSYVSARQVKLELFRRSASGDTLLKTEFVNKGAGALSYTFGLSNFVNGSIGALSGGIQLVGFSGEPVASSFASLMGSAPFLAARYNPARANFDLYPATGWTAAGQGYFLRVNADASPTFSVNESPGTSVSIALRPGWNLISAPRNVPVAFDRIEVVRGTDFPISYNEAAGLTSGSTPILGRDLFDFEPGPPDPASGVPEGGTFRAASGFQVNRGYFIRCLAPEGATLLFNPAGGQSFGKQSPGTGPLPQVSVRVLLSGNRKEGSEVFLGLDNRSTRGFDARWDSSLPPSVGGLQLAVDSGDARYRDVRPVSTRETFRVVARDCRIGQTYTLTLSRRTGTLEFAELTNLISGGKRTLRDGTGRITFRASAKTMLFDISLRGAR